MTFDAENIIAAAEAAAAQAVGSASRDIEMLFLSHTPATRRESRRAIRTRLDGTEAEVGFIFPSSKRYRTNNTETERIAERAWKPNAEATLHNFEQSFSDEIERELP